MASPELGFAWFGFHVPLRSFVLGCELTNVEPLRVGAGRSGGGVFELTDLVVLRLRDQTGNEAPVVPGSSWKGVFRSHCVRVARSRELGVCDGVPGATHLRGNEFDELERGGATALDKLRRMVDGSIRVCLNCLVFGAPGLASHVVFFDSLLRGFRLGSRTMVAINRRTGATHPGALFTVEYVEPGSRVPLEVRAFNLPNYALGWLVKVIKDIDLGLVKIGGLKSRGFGGMRVEKDSLKLVVVDHRGEDASGPLDPVDSKVEGAGGSRVELEGEEAWEYLEGLERAWESAVEKLLEVSKSNWRWSVLVEPRG